MVNKLCASARDGLVTDDEIAFGQASSPAAVIPDITAPTLLLGGTVDTLFPLLGNIDTYRALRAAGTPVKMMWYCGGHGLCNQSTGPAGHVLDAERAFFAKYLKDADVDVGPGFEYLDQNGVWRSAATYPIEPTATVTGQGSGWLPLSFFNTSGLLGIVATKAANAVTIPIAPPRTSVDVTGAPSLRLTYWGQATMGSAPIFAQLLDTATGKIVGNIATPVQLDLDGRSHTTTVPLGAIAWNLTPASRLALQLTDSSNLFFGQQAFGLVSLKATVTLPTAAPGPATVG
jgi:ABC-2 type transport system ATP-binding protein